MSYFQSFTFNRVVVPISFVGSVVCGGLLIQQSYAGKKCPSIEKIEKKVVVVTGANSGIGKATAEELSRRGGTIVMACRHMGKCEAAAKEIRSVTKNKHVVCRFLDLASLDSIESFAKNIKNELDKVDILINNAGVLKPRPPRTTYKTGDGFERQFSVNYLGPYLLTNLLIPMLKKSEQGRIINVASSSNAFRKGHLDVTDIDKEHIQCDGQEEKLHEFYYQSKLAMVMFTKQLSEILQSSNDTKHVTVNCLDPGIAATNIGRYSIVPFYMFGELFIKPLRKIRMKTPLQAAQTSIFLAVDQNLSSKSGYFYENCTEVSHTSTECDKNMCVDLWKFSENAVNLKNKFNKIHLK